MRRPILFKVAAFSLLGGIAKKFAVDRVCTSAFDERRTPIKL
jgi:F0F1-type ATP synthase membrane subunit b/b'